MADILYTGRGLAAKLPETGNTMQGLVNFVARAEETKFNVFQKNKDAFMKMTDVDPVMFLTTANQEAQAKLLDDFNKEAAQIYKNSGGFPSMEEMQQIQAKKNYLVSEQQKMQADMEQVLLEKEVIEKDNGVNYDPQEWYQKKYQPYIETGKWDKTPMVKRAKPIESVFRGKVTGAGAYEEPDPDNPSRLRQTSASKKDVAVRIADTIFADESVKRHALEEWRTLPDSEKEQYLNDANGDGMISDEERQQGDVLVKSLDNPIIKSYVDKHWANLVDVRFTNKQRPASTGSGKPTISDIIGEKRDIDPMYGNISRPNIYSLGGDMAITDIPTAGAKLLDDTGSYDYNLRGNPAKAFLKDYDADRNTVIVQVPSKDPVSGIDTKQLVEVPVKNILSKVKDIKVVVNGVTTTIGALVGTTTATKPSFLEWKKISGNENKTFKDYTDAR